MFKKIVALFRGSSTPPAEVLDPATGLPYTGQGLPLMPACDRSGVIWTRLSTGAGGLALTGGTVVSDDVVAAGINGLDTRSFLYGFDGATFDRLRTLADNGDAQAALTLGLLSTVSRLQGFNGATWDRLRSGGNNVDAEAVATLGLLRNNIYPTLFNETTWDRQRGNTEFTLLPSAARTVTTNSADIINFNAKGIYLFFNITAVPGVDTVTLVYQQKDPVSGNYFQHGTAAAQIATGLTTFLLYPAAISNASAIQNASICRTSRIRVVPSGAGSFTYSVGGCFLL